MPKINFAKIDINVNEDVETKVLSIKFPRQDDLKFLFVPKLENIGFIMIETTVSINLKNPVFRVFFNKWVEGFLDKINIDDSSEILIEKFNKEIRAIVLFGKKEKKISVNKARGLYGELLVIKSYLTDNKKSQQDILNGWHRPSASNHDFDYHDYTLEVKTVARSNSTVKIRTEDQLTAFEDKSLNLIIFKIENITGSNLDSLGDLFIEIKAELEPALINIFEMKCAEDTYCQYLGPEHDPLDYKFILLEESLYDVDQVKFPRIRKEKIDNGISKTSYEIDLSIIEDFKI